ncbi:glutamate 5-kinase [[Limnothrix rosea] IAM M-220]|uniref:glutamate 5-kinase n=1 Tax=[Limnothrix rosea] IAM M-220 TaxID=454133 RepID=UPI00095CFF01|nr:glutamate 5-kinase [[Limnothrix rosea] IAM M-220]OKH16960.1 glutamate 5-kinase [[Limnothrix rosea] IAM M-220]
MSQTIVVKIGTSSLTDPETGMLALATIGTLVETLTRLKQMGHNVILVSSGAVGVGCGRLNLSERPKKIAVKQAVAAVGQGRLIRLYDDLFTSLQQAIAQVLLTRKDLVDRTSYLTVQEALNAMLELGVIPIVNENDTVAVDELKFGDNDTLSALVASLVNADWLVILTDVDRLYSADPRHNPDAKPIPLVSPTELSQLQVDAGSSGSQWGTGGMQTKLTAAKIATNAGVRTVITQGKTPQNLIKIIQGDDIGTHFEANPQTDNSRKRWIAYGLVPQGKLYLDDGAAKALLTKGKSLLAAGIIKTEGNFSVNDAVELCHKNGQAIARGLVNYDSAAIAKIKGKHSKQITEILGYTGADTIIHRDNLAFLLGSPGNVGK